MFNKPNVFSRNETITRRDSQPAAATGLPSANSPIAAEAGGALPAVPAAAAGTVGHKLVAAQAASTPAVGPAVSPVRTAVAEPRPSPANDKGIDARLLVGPDVKLKGAEILDCDTLVVEGRVEATMDSRVIRIAESGAFVGKVSIDIAEIHGSFDGELTARCQLIIHSTGRVSGKIRYGKLVVDEGGELCGEIGVLADQDAARPRTVIQALAAAVV